MTQEIQQLNVQDLLHKQGPAVFAERLIHQVSEGELDCRQVAALFKFWEDVIKLGKEGIRDTVRDEIQKHGKSMTYHGIEIKAIEAGTKYDYSRDPMWCALNKEFLEVKKRKDDWEAMLRKMKEGTVSTDTETGEVIAVSPTKTSTSTYSVTFPAD